MLDELGYDSEYECSVFMGTVLVWCCRYQPESGHAAWQPNDFTYADPAGYDAGYYREGQEHQGYYGEGQELYSVSEPLTM
jgi:hypothetical protein